MAKVTPLRKEFIFSKGQAELLLTTMLRGRLCDLKAIVLYKQNKCHFQIGCAGHEAIQAATSLVFDPKKDWFYPYYRDMALVAGLGMTDRELMMNAMNRDADPNSHGRQMPMHYGHKGLHIVNQSSPTGTQFLQAVGCALASRKLGSKDVVYVSAGEGTCSQGDFHEALNWASREKLKVVFCIQNNSYAISVPISEQLGAKSVYDLTSGYENLKRFSVDGSSVSECYKAMLDAYNYEGPSLVEAHVVRLQSHSISDDHLKYRTKEEIEREKERDPIQLFKKEIVQAGLFSTEQLEELESKLKRDIDEAAEWAESQPECDPSRVEENVYALPDPSLTCEESIPSGEEIYMVDALNHALDEELKRDKNTFIFGQDVAHGKGGVFTVTAGLTAKHGNDRVFNAPLAESSIVGVAIGMATRGLKPIAEIQFGDYCWTAMMQIRNELAMMLYRSGGDFSCPAVIRIPVGGYIRGGCYHSQNIEATFAHFPGLFVVYPSNATDAKGLLKAAIRSKNPVLFLEHKGLYRQVYAKGKEGGVDDLIPIGKAKVIREGKDLSIITYGALVQKSLLVAKELEKQGKSVEVVDLRTIVPLDEETILKSVSKTNRVLIAHEDTIFMGFGAEIAALISEKALSKLDAPIKRIGMKNVSAVPHSPILETAVLPQTEGLLEAASQLIAY
jgi:2-oxoisovalerate dehydrogenase E1 component